MNYPAKILACFSSLLCGSTQNAETQSSVKNEVVIHEGRTMRIIVPDSPLTSGSVKIVPKSDHAHFSEWDKPNIEESQELIQRIVQVWKKNGVKGYLVYGKESDQSKSIFSWEIVPYQECRWRWWQQFKVLWRIIFGGSSLSQNEKIIQAKDFKKELESLSASQPEQIKAIDKVGNDLFCKESTIARQQVFEGKTIRILYDHAPLAIGEGQPHFLLLPKRHRKHITDLTPEEYLESNELEQQLICHYKDKGFHTAYLFEKNDFDENEPFAGQSVFHRHRHLVFIASKTQDLFGKLMVLKRMSIGSSRLSEDELKKRVQSLRSELSKVLKVKD
ncbi:MAG: HIT family protein [Chlamydiales bacterium]